MEYTFTWFIENYSYCLQKNEEPLYSPEFFVSGLESTAWCIRLYPRGSSTQHKGYISLFLQRSQSEVKPESIVLNFELSLLGKDGPAVKSKEFRNTFRRGYMFGLPDFLRMDELFSIHEATLLSEGILTVSCKMQSNEGVIHKVGQGSARTIIGTEHVSFFHVVEDFSTFSSDIKNTSLIRYSTEEEHFTSSIELDDITSRGRRLIFEIAPSSTEKILTRCDLFLMGASETLMKCGAEDNRSDETRKEIRRSTLCLTREEILRLKQYLPSDKLTLLCQCTFSTGVMYEKIERILPEMPSLLFNQINFEVLNYVEYRATANPPDSF